MTTSDAAKGWPRPTPSASIWTTRRPLGRARRVGIVSTWSRSLPLRLFGIGMVGVFVYLHNYFLLPATTPGLALTFALVGVTYAGLSPG
jgi:hypothetical protein